VSRVALSFKANSGDHKAMDMTTAMISNLGPLAQLRTGRLPRRLVQLFAGLTLYGVALGLMVRAQQGLAPWDVLHSGLARWLPLSLGQVLIATSFVVLLLWLPLGEKPGIGTVANAVVIGLALDATITLVPPVSGWLPQSLLMLVGVLLNGVASAAYIGAQLGRGPRDGLMTGLARTTGGSLRLIRTAIEVVVVLTGLLLGGSVGIGTLAYALSIGPLTQAFLPSLAVRRASA
jgi:uncharacterized membrane protein YczE